MVKNVEASAFVPDLTPEEVFDRVFAGPEAMRCYHAECNKDPSASVGPWDGDTREIVFATKVSMPAALTRTLGIETLTIREVSTRQDAAGGAIHITSRPILEFPGGSKFTTSSVLRLEPSDGGCQMRVDVSCAAAGPWGLVGTIEDSMAAQARSTIDGFLAFCVSWCESEGATAEPTAMLNGEVSPADSVDETFFDASAMSDASGFSRAASSAAELQQLSSRLKAVEAAVRTLEARQQRQLPLPVPRFWAVSAASFALAALAVGGIAVLAIKYGERRAFRTAGPTAQPT